MPSKQLPEIDFDYIDKVGHFGVYWILAMLMLWGVYKQGQPIIGKTLFTVVVIGVTYGVLIELMQYLFFPDRYFEFLDALANTIGCIFGIASFKLFFKL